MTDRGALGFVGWTLVVHEFWTRPRAWAAFWEDERGHVASPVADNHPNCVDFLEANAPSRLEQGLHLRFSCE